MILFCTALREERVAVRKAWNTSFSGSLGGVELDLGEGCALLCSGVGADRLEHALEIGTRVYKPTLTVLVGFSAGLSNRGRVGDVYWDPRSDKDLIQSFSGLNLNGRPGRAATCGFLNSVGEKIEFARSHPESVVADLESERFLEWVRGPKLVLRAISDELSTSLPVNFENYLDSSGFPDLQALAHAVLTRPRLLPQFLELAKGSRICVNNLSRFLADTSSLLGERSAALC